MPLRIGLFKKWFIFLSGLSFALSIEYIHYSANVFKFFNERKQTNLTSTYFEFFGVRAHMFLPNFGVKKHVAKMALFSVSEALDLEHTFIYYNVVT